MANQVNRTVNIFIESGEAQKAYDRLIAKEKALKDELVKATDPKVVKRLSDEINKLQEPISRAAKKVSGELSPSVKEATKAVQALDRELKHMSEEDPGFAKKVAQFKQATAELKNAKAAAAGAQQSVSNGNVFTRGLGKLNDFSQNTFGVGFGAAAGLAAAGAFLKTAAEEALQAEETTARFKATLDNLGKADAFDRLTDSADRFAKKFKFIDNDDVVGVFDKLITYGKLTEREINQVTPVIVDFASKQRISLSESADVIIKALEGNGKALKTYGINLKETGTTSERLGVILNDLGKKVNGAAETFGNENSGKIKSAKQQFLDLAESLGTKLLPAIGFIASAFQAIIIGAEEFGNRVASTFNFLFNQTKFYADKLQEETDRIAKHGVDVARQESDFKGKTTQEIEKQVKLYEGMLQLANARLETEEAQRKANELNKVIYVEKIRLAKEELQARIEIAARDKKENEERDKKAKEKSDAEAKKRAEEIRKLREQLSKIEAEFNLKGLSALQQKLGEINLKFDELVKKAKELNDPQDVIRANADRKAAIEKAYDDLLRKGILIPIKLDSVASIEQAEDIHKKVTAVAEKSLSVFTNTYLASDVRIAEIQKQISKLRGRERLEALLKELDEREKQEIARAESIGLKTKPIIEKFEKERAAIILKYYTTTLEGITTLASNVTSIFGQFNDALNQSQNAQLESDRVANDRKRENFKKQLDGKVISQKEYDAKIAKLDDEQRKRENKVKRDQFRRNQILSVAQATINGAQGATKTIAELGFPLAIPFIALAGLATLAQIGFILKEKPPQLAKGGMLKGPLHSEGGMPVVNPKTGKAVAEMEGGEAVLSRATVKNNAALVNQLLESSMHHNGRTIQPKWRNAQPSYLNIPVIHQSMQVVKHYARGGLFQADGQTGNTDQAAVILPMFLDAVNALNFQLAKGIKSYTVLSEQQAQQDRLDIITNDATMRP